MTREEAQQSLFVQRSRAVLDRFVDSLELDGVLAERLYSGSVPVMTTLYTANPAATVADVYDAVWPLASQAVRERAALFRRGTAFAQPRIQKIRADTLLRNVILREVAESVSALLSRDPEANDSSLEAAIAPAFRPRP
jgi:hypothetical protein